MARYGTGGRPNRTPRTRRAGLPGSGHRAVGGGAAPAAEAGCPGGHPADQPGDGPQRRRVRADELAWSLGLGAKLGDGRQRMPMIALDDYLGVVQWAADNAHASGPYNLTIPEPTTNTEFTDELARQLHRPAVPRRARSRSSNRARRTQRPTARRHVRGAEAADRRRVPVLLPRRRLGRHRRPASLSCQPRRLDSRHDAGLHLPRSGSRADRLPAGLGSAAHAARRGGRRARRTPCCCWSTPASTPPASAPSRASGRPTARRWSTSTAAARSPGTGRVSWSATRSSGCPSRSASSTTSAGWRRR